MKNAIVILLFFLGLCSCNNNTAQPVQPLQQTVPRPIPTKPSYEAYLAAIREQKQRLPHMDSVPAFLINCIGDEMYEYWKGTRWDFNGTTQKPQEGVIACGYFVTTLLKHIGFPINRVRLAQQAAAIIVKETTTDVKKISGYEAMYRYVATQAQPGVYIVGLDFHVGFIIKEINGQAYFLHSNYIQREGVVKEPLQQSLALKQSKLYYIGSLTANTNLLWRWMKG